ncbi:MAG: arabinose efflux permease [Haloquadratum sp. J07HQX50]|nr:MAG: arabinose efflux permease [Haloquadratum sp. J07HQX50]
MLDTWRDVGLVSGWQAAASLCYYSIFAATGFIRDSFALSESLVGLFLTAAVVGYTVALFPSGAAVDGFGERRIMVCGLIGLAITAVVLPVAPSYGALLVATVLLGASYSPAMPASNRGIARNAPPDQLNLAMGVKQVGVTTGSALASVIITGIAAVVWWPIGFWVIALLASGYTVGFAQTYDGGNGTGELTLPDIRSLLTRPAYLLLLAAGAFIGASIFTMLGYIVLYFQDVVGAAAAIGGLVLAGTQLTGSAARIGAGSLADRLSGVRGAATVALGQVAVAAVLFTILTLEPESLLTSVGLFLGLGLSIHGSTGIYYSCLTGLVETDELGAASAGGQTAINLGGITTPPLFGYLVQTTGYYSGWAILAVMTAIATILLFIVRRRVSPL